MGPQPRSRFFSPTDSVGAFFAALAAHRYHLLVNLLDARRRAPRIFVDGLCGVASHDDLHPAAMTNLSTLGLQLERPFDPRTARPVVQLEIELPEVDEILWASAAVTHAHLTPLPGRTPDDQPRFHCRAGLRILDVSRRERRLLLDYVVDQLRRRTRPADRRRPA
jgi:hypothetical protein